MDIGANPFDQTNVNIAYFEPDTLDFSFDIDTIVVSLRYLINDISWNISSIPSWVTLIEDRRVELRGSNTRSVIEMRGILGLVDQEQVHLIEI